MATNQTSKLHYLLAPAFIFVGLFLIASNTAILNEQIARLGLGIDPEVINIISGMAMWMAGALLLSRLILALFLNPFSRRRTGQDAPDILVNCIYAIVFVVAGFSSVHYVLDKPVGALMATSGLVTLIIGLAIRDMIADFFSGLAINFERPYSIGDWIELEPGLVGKVTELNWRSTRLVTMSDRTVIVPNNNFAARQFVNYSLPRRSYRESLSITLNYTADPERIENILQSAISATTGLMVGGDHNVRIKNFSERGVEYETRIWIDDLSKRVGLRHKLAANILRYLNQAGVSIPYQQQDVLITHDRRARQERRIDTKRLLSRIDWLEPLQDHELEQLAEVAKPHDFPKGTIIFNEGEEGDSLYLVVEGIANVRTGTNGSSKMVGKIEPGQALGEMSVLTGTPRRASVTADTDVHALSIHRVDLEPILRARPQIAQELGNMMAARVMAMNADMNSRNHDQTLAGDHSLAKQLANRISQFFGIGTTH
ncbi:MAG: cyclic nucleotide-binding domain-containing protein [Gammaproteobacteria bacterium]